MPPPRPSIAGTPDRPDARLLLKAYARGIFPMADARTRRIEWYCPDPRGVLPLEALRVPRSLAKVVRSGRFEIRLDTATSEVMRACAGARGRWNPSWMTSALMDAYEELRVTGHVHSVEAWREGRLVGGLYGVRLGGAFFGESMFVRPDLGGSNASKVCLVHLVERLRRGGFVLLDTQMVNDHMATLGAVEIPAADYLAQLRAALAVEGRWEAGSRDRETGIRIQDSGGHDPRT